MKKKLTASLLCLSLLLIMLLGSTLAWFTDESGSVNTMTVGNVHIQQYQKDRANNDFDPNHPLFPVTSTADSLVEIGGKNFAFLSTQYNAVDQIVTIKNTGVLSAYVRTVFAFEMLETTVMDNEGNPTTQWVNPIATGVVHLNVNGTLTFPSVEFDYNGVRYVVGVYTYTDALVAGETTDPSLLQIYLDSNVGNEFYDQVGAKYDVLVLSQAVQIQGFDSAADAFTAAFPLTEANAARWFGTYAPTT